MPAEPTLRAVGASKSYGDLTALAPLDLILNEGERIALVGHNGSGKSTLLQLVAGLLELTQGTIEVLGVPVGTSDARAAVSFVPDDPVLYDDLSVREHLAYVAGLHGIDADLEDFDDLLDQLGLLDRADDLPARFSRGLRQKTSIAVGLIRPFALLLIDEPFVGLDAPARRPCSPCSTRPTRAAQPSWSPPMTRCMSSVSTAVWRCVTASSSTTGRRP